MFALTFALPEESAAFRKLLRRAGADNKANVRPGFDPSVIPICHVGVGSHEARVRIRALFAQNVPSALCAAGFAGALDSRLQVGDLVVDTRHSDQQLARAARRAFSDAFECHDHPSIESCARGAANIPPSLWFGSIVSVDSPVESAAEKHALHRRTGAVAVDMETEALAAECRSARIPFIAVRVVSDDAHHDLPVPMAHWFDLERQHANPGALIRYLAVHPRTIPSFFRFVLPLHRARTTLARALILLLREAAQTSGANSIVNG
jgi:adenosylhomocysteine nucleosidase